MFTNVITGAESSLSIQTVLLCSLVSLVLGLFIAFIYTLQGTCNKSFVITLSLLPILVQLVIMMVNGNLGTSVAVLGAFSLVRFRSVPGNSKDIACIFFAMAIGLTVGTGYLSFAVAMTLLIGMMFLILTKVPFEERNMTERHLRIVIAETLDYTEIFEDIFKTYTSKYVLDKVKTTNLGSMYELSYNIKLKDTKKEKEMIDELRCRNGNLTIICGRKSTIAEEL